MIGIRLFLILLSAFFLRLLLLPYWTHGSDMNLWIHWGNEIYKLGFDGFFDKVTWTDYLPFYFYILWFLHWVSSFLPNIPLEYLYKLPGVLADLGTAYFLFKILEKRNRRLALQCAALYVLNPAVFFNSSLWGQVDGIGALFVAASLYFLLGKRFIYSGIALGLALTFKPLFVVALPIFGLVLFFKSSKKHINIVFRYVLAVTITIWTVCFPFVLTKAFAISGLITAPFTLLYERYLASTNQYPYTSVNAFNFWSIGERWWVSDQTIFLNFALQGWGMAIVAVFVVVSTVYFLKFKNRPEPARRLALVLFIVFLALYSFATRAHERHMFTMFPFLALLAVENASFFALYLTLSASYFANLYFALFWYLRGGQYPFDWNLINVFSFVNFFIPFVLITVLAVSIYKGKDLIEVVLPKRFSFLSLGAGDAKPIKEKSIFKKKWVIIAFLVLSFLRIYRFDLPPTHYFDEVYHAFTAQEIVKNNPLAWEFSASPPKGFAYEWTHPPLAKLFMAGGIYLFGQTPFAWRLPGVLIGFGCLLLVFVLTKTLFKRNTIAIWAVLLFTLDGMSIVMSRIGMNDIYFLFFTLGTLVFFLNSKYIFASLFLGAALASKWTSFFIFPILFVAWILYKREFNTRYLFFLIIPPLVYLASYTFFFTSGHNLSDFWETQKQMWWYHTNLKATHPYSSSWWSWPLMLKPLWLYTQSEGGSVTNLYVAGNPVVFYGSIVAVICSGLALLKKFNKGVLLALFCYLVFFMPWSVSPRIMFIYHYFPSVPFMIILLSWLLFQLWESNHKRLVVVYFVLVVAGFVLYYPHWVGIAMPVWWDKIYYFLPTWR